LQYVSECAPTRIRGLMMVGYSIFWSFGTLISSLAMFAMQETYEGEERQ
jgi:hypothetical protein